MNIFLSIEKLNFVLNCQHKWGSIGKVILELKIAGTIILSVDDQLLYRKLTNEICPAHFHN